MSCKVTVLLPAFNAERHIGSSILSILHQDFPDFELLIIDDGSTDGTAEVAKKFEKTDSRVQLVSNGTNIGLAASLNKGLERAQGEYIARQDADDLSRQNRLSLQVKHLDANPEIGIVGSGYESFYPDSSFRKKYAPISNWHLIAWNIALGINVIAHPSVMLRASLLEARNAYDTEFPASQDFELWSRLILRTRFHNLHDPLVFKREHEAQLSHTHKGAKPELWGRIIRSFSSKLLARDVEAQEVKALLAFTRRHGVASKDDLSMAIPLAFEIFEALGNALSFTRRQQRDVIEDMTQKITACPPPLAEQNIGGRALFRETLRKIATRFTLPQSIVQRSHFAQSSLKFFKPPSSFSSPCAKRTDSSPLRKICHMPNMLRSSFPSDKNLDLSLRLNRFTSSPQSIFTTDSPGRVLCKLFWNELPWKIIQQELGEIHILEISCGKENHASLLQERPKDMVSSYNRLNVPERDDCKGLSIRDALNSRSSSGDNQRAVPPSTNFIVSQSAPGHIPSAGAHISDILRFIENKRQPAIQMHFAPSPQSQETFGTQGCRHYGLRKLSKSTSLFRSEHQRSIFLLGGAHCNSVQNDFIAKPLRQGKCDGRLLDAEEYSAQLERAIRADSMSKDTDAAYQALMVSSFTTEDISQRMKNKMSL